MKLNFDKFKEWALLGLLSGGVFILWQMKSSVEELNIKIAVLIKEQELSKGEIDDHESRIRQLEQVDK